MDEGSGTLSRMAGADSLTPLVGRPPGRRSAPVAAGDGSGAGHLRARLLASDFAAGFLTWMLVLPGYDRRSWSDVAAAVALSAGLAAVVVVVLAVQKLYLARVCSVRSIEIVRLGRAAVVSALAAVGSSRVWPVHISLSRAAVGAAGLIAALLVFRGSYRIWLRRCRSRGRFCRPVCILASDAESEALLELLSGQPGLGYRAVAVIGYAMEEGTTYPVEIPVVDAGADLAATVRSTGATGVIVAPGALPGRALDQAVRGLVAAGIHVQVSSGLPRIGYHRMRVAPLSHQVLFYVERRTISRWQLVVKRAIDVIFTTVALSVALPVMALAGVVIKMEDGGPVLYRQDRIGRHGHVFRVLKLRTMSVDAGERLNGLRAHNERQGPLFKMATDPRVTRVGRILRKSCIDELPQLFNVLRGEMSLVGPRPALPSEVEDFDQELRERLVVAPGVTGLWQVEASESPSFHAYRRLDLHYVDNWSVGMDMMILGATVGLVLQRLVDLVITGARRSAGAELVELRGGGFSPPPGPPHRQPIEEPQVVGGS